MAFAGIFGSGQKKEQPPPAAAQPSSATGNAVPAASAIRKGTADSSPQTSRNGNDRKVRTMTDDDDQLPELPLPINEITKDVLRRFMNKDWDTKSHKHITFRGKEFQLESLEGLVRLSGTLHQAGRIDLSRLESFDVSENLLRDLNCLRGTQGFHSLRVLKARRNVLVYFEVNLPTLRELDLSHNRLKEIPPTSGMPELEVCILAHNDMHSSFAALRNFKMLKKLDLCCNRFEFRPTELAEQIAVLEGLPLLHAFRIKDNPFCRLLPEYQALILQRLPNLSKFDDMEVLPENRELALSFDVDNLDSYDRLVFERGKADRLATHKHEMSQAKEGHGPVFQDLIEPIQEALADSTPDQTTKTVKELIRICEKIHQMPPDHMVSIFRDLKEQHNSTHKEQGPHEQEIVDAAITSFLGDFAILHSRVDEDEAQRVTLLRCLAKLGIVHESNLGERCLNRLGWLMKRSPEAEKEVLKVVEEIVVKPLEFSGISSGDKKWYPVVRGLAKFDSPRLPEALAPIAGWLAKNYCASGASPQQDITRLLAVATRNQVNTERALAFNTDTYASGGGKQDSLAQHVILALENKTLTQNESLREQFMGHLQIVHNTAKYGGQRIVEVYEEKQLHRDLVKKLKDFFGDAPIDTSKTYTKANPQRQEIDLEKMKVLDTRTCAALIDAIVSLMEQSNDILSDLADAKPPVGIPVVEYFSIAPRAQISDPVLLASSLRGVYLILDKYAHENAAARNEMISLIIKDMEKMGSMLEYINGDTMKYQRLWQKAEYHLAQRQESGGKSTRVEIGQAPKLVALTNPLVHEAFEAIVTVVKYFTAHAGESKQCAQVSKAMDGMSREQLLFQLLQVPSTSVRMAVMSTLGEVDSSEMSSSEVGYLIELLNQATDLAREDSLLQQVIMQLQKFAAERDGAGAGAALRSDHPNTSIDAVMAIFIRNSMRNTYNAEEEQDKTKLSKACVLYLKTVSKWPDLRETNLRSKNINGSLIDALKFEDEFHSIWNPCITAEGTWTGRSVETLLQCISGKERLKARGKVAYRVICRIADVLQGRSDMPRASEIEDRDCRQMAEEECKMFDEAKQKQDLKHLDDVERTDRSLQQQVFASFNGLDRLAVFLTDLHGSLEKKQVARMSEQAAQNNAMDFMHKATTEAAQMHASGDSAQVAITQVDIDNPPAALQDAVSDDESNNAALRIISYAGGSFPHESGTVNLRHGRDGSAYPGAFGKAVSIHFKAVIDQVKPWSCILDLGSGGPRDNIVVLADGLDLVFQIFVGSDGTSSELRAANALQTSSDADSMRRFLLTITPKGEMKIWVGDGDPTVKKQNCDVPRLVKRHMYYVGSSSLQNYAPLHGTIADLMVWSGGTGLDWAEMEELMQGEKIDRKLVMSVMNKYDPQRPLPAKPDLQVGSSLGSCLPRDLQVKEAFNDREGQVNVAMPIAAMLRACFVLLKVPATNKIKEAMTKSLKDYLMVGRLLSLVTLCGPFDCCIAAKFMRLMSAALRLAPSQSKTEVEQVVVFDLLAKYYAKLCGTVARAVSQQDNPTLAARGRLTATEFARLAATILSTIPFCTDGPILQPEAKVQNSFFEKCYLRLMPISIVKSLMQMALDSSMSSSSDDKSREDMEQANQMWELLRVTMSALLDKCPPMKYDIFMMFSSHVVNGSPSLRQSFLSGVLTQMKQAEDKSKLQQGLGDISLMPEPEPMLPIANKVEGPERTVAYARCEVLIVTYPPRPSSWIQVQDPSSSTPFLACVVSNKQLMILDASAAGYPKNPTFVQQRDLRDLTRIIRGVANQVIYVGLLSRRAGEGEADGLTEEFMVLLCHRESDRSEILGALHSLSVVPGGDIYSRVPLQTDQIFRKALDTIVVDAPMLMTFAMHEVNGVSELRLFVLTANQFYEITVSFENWFPADQNPEEAGSESDKEVAEDDLSKQAESGTGGSKHKKGDEEAMLAGIFGGVGETSGAAKRLKQQIDEVMKGKKRARNHPKNVGDEQVEIILKVSPPGAPINPRRMAVLEKLAFYPDDIPKMALNFEDGDKVTMVFFDDATRETWKRTLIGHLTRPDQSGSKWVRSYGGKNHGR